MTTTATLTSKTPHSDAAHPPQKRKHSVFWNVIKDMMRIDAYSEAFVWDSKFSTKRFGAVIAPKGYQTLLQAVVHAPLTTKDRSTLFPTAFHPGSDQTLELDQCTYQAIADAVARTCKFSAGSIDEKFVKQTANALSKLTGFSVMEHRVADPIRFTRTVWLFSFLKKTRGPSMVGMLKPPGADSKPSLEITNPYPLGTQNEKRAQFADVATYLSLQLPADVYERIENCLPNLMPAYEDFIDAIKLEVSSRPEGVHAPTVAVGEGRLRAAKHYYKKRMDELQNQANQSVKPLDEVLYVHAKTLELRHFAAFRSVLKGMPAQRPDIPLLNLTGIREALPQFIEAIDAEDSVESYRKIATALFERRVDKTEVLKATQLAQHVLRHHLSFTRKDIHALEKPMEFATMSAAVMYSLKLNEDQAAHNYSPHVYGQGRVATSLISAIKGKPNDRHEEFEHMIIDSVTWYRAALFRQLNLHRELLELRDVVEQGLAKLCATNDLVVLEKALSLMREAPSVQEWKH